MFGILSNSLRVATRQDGWSSHDMPRAREEQLPTHWRDNHRGRPGHASVLDQAAEGARPKLLGK